ncbi:MAG: AAA family ATPase [Saprospiraceae bacterium]|nr:AAA family ATPase [Candidatus Vicinibacter affinis]
MTIESFLEKMKEFMSALNINQLIAGSDYRYLGINYDIAFGSPGGSYDPSKYPGFQFSNDVEKLLIRMMSEKNKIIIEDINNKNMILNYSLNNENFISENPKSIEIKDNYIMTVRHKISKDTVKKALFEVGMKSDTVYKGDSDNWHEIIFSLISWARKRAAAKNKIRPLLGNDYDNQDIVTNYDFDEIAKIKPLNRILYGPPGTGKTFHSITHAVSIIDNEPIENLYKKCQNNENRSAIKLRFDELVLFGQIVFTTFHQSLSYEDFIEGIKPLPPEKDRDLKYDIVNGIFKTLCNRAESNWLSHHQKDGNKVTFENVFDEFKEKWEAEPNMKFGMKTEGKEFRITGFSNKSIYFKKASGGEGHSLSINTLRDIYYKKRATWENGVGIYYPGILEKLNVFVPSLSESPDKVNNFVLIIDEINRGNVSQIFGELITLIEDDKRIGEPEALKVTLPYSGDYFAVPPNLYLIGTMNTADRSVEALDTALRRRFSFKQLSPDASLLDATEEGIDLKLMLEKMNKRLTILKDSDHTIGHAWFMENVAKKNVVWLQGVFRDKILPLLQEYFYGDFEKIGMVLGERFFEEMNCVNKKDFAKFTKGTNQANLYNQSWQYK